MPILRQTLKDRPSLEARTRLEGILEALDRGPSPGQLRLLRVLVVQEWSNRPEAREHLRWLAAGAPSTSLTHAAKAARQRRKR